MKAGDCRVCKLRLGSKRWMLGIMPSPCIRCRIGWDPVLLFWAAHCPVCEQWVRRVCWVAVGVGWVSGFFGVVGLVAGRCRLTAMEAHMDIRHPDKKLQAAQYYEESRGGERE